MILCMTAATVFFGVFAYLYLTAGEELSETLIASCMEIQPVSYTHLTLPTILLV